MEILRPLLFDFLCCLAAVQTLVLAQDQSGKPTLALSTLIFLYLSRFKILKLSMFIRLHKSRLWITSKF